MRPVLLRTAALAVLSLGCAATGSTQGTQAAAAVAPVTLFENVRVFDGKSAAVSAPSNVLVKGGRIARISTAAIAVDGAERATVIAGAEATDTLMRGFTTVRDLGGPVRGLKQAIDAGVVAGPRIFPSGAVITVTSGHGDFRMPFELLAPSGLRSPYPGKLGVVEEGALADLLLVDGNPLESIKPVENPARNFVVIMKDGKAHKNLLAPRAP